MKKKTLMSMLAVAVSGSALAMGGGGASAPVVAPVVEPMVVEQPATEMAPIIIPAKQPSAMQPPIASAQHDVMCQPVTEEAVASLFDRWNASLQTLEPSNVADNYAADAVLLPTVSNRPRVSREGIEDYFVNWLTKGPEGEIVYSYIDLGCNTATDAGVYKFTYDNGKEVVARYTYTYEYDEQSGEWLISTHHSSAMPQDIATEAVEEF